MAGINLLQYPELLLAGAAAVGLAFTNSKKVSAAHGSFDASEEFSSDSEPASASPVARRALLLSPLFQLSLVIFHFLPVGYREWVARMLNWGNRRTNRATGEFASSKLLFSLVSMPLFMVAPVFVIPLAAAVLYFIPDFFLWLNVGKRQQSIRQALPQALDLMVLCVDAGLGLDATIQRIASDNSGLSHALNDELASLGRDILLGMDRGRAYGELYQRTGVDELKMLGSALFQSTKMGLSIARILRAQAAFLRARHAQKAEEKAARLPVWMAFPLWVCVMPALLFVIMGPAFITFTQQIGNVKSSWFN